MDRLTPVLDFVHFGDAFSHLRSDIHTPAFWLAVGQIIWINVLLSGDNALVIAMACRDLGAQQRVWGMALGAGVAVLLRVIFTGIVATLMSLPYLKLVGGLALLVVAAKLLVPDEPDKDDVAAARHLWAAVQIVAVADIVMSLDNVIAVAAAANGNVVLLVLGLVISVPLIVAGATLIMMLLDKLPILIWGGAALLGWVAGDVMATDPVVLPWLDRIASGGLIATIAAASRSLGIFQDGAEFACAFAGTVVVLIAGSLWRRHAMARHVKPG